MTKKKQPPSLPASPSIADLRAAIAQAQVEGIRAKDMVLHLTHRDESRIKRSRDVALDEVSFNEGEMRFLGIRVVTGDVTVSVLDREA